MAHPLSGVRVVEIGDRIAAAYAGKLLRDAGADVIVVEPDGGSSLRRSGQFFDYLAGGKRSVVAT
ncbi:MAG: CoA transferase, partial [Mycobacteriaceae bacterium]|nr:CoA transferase [Mycobacteriaceae bacterium]